MKIPAGRSGYPTVSPTMLRRYGSAGFELEEHEDSRGCPRQYMARYVEQRVPDDDSDILRYGRVVHRALQVMDDDQLPPEEALQRVWDPALGADWYQEALADLRGYLERPAAPLERLVIDNEMHLQAPLYVDDVYGEIWIQGYIDQLEVDPEHPDVVHLRDFKTNRSPASVEDVLRDAQMKTYVFLVKACWREIGLPREPRVVVHLDLIKWRELPGVVYSEDAMEAWYAITVAVVRAILRDEEATPVVTPGCAYCPVKGDCPAYLAISDLATQLLQVKPANRDHQVAWMDRANAVRLLLQKAVEEMKAQFDADARLLGTLTAGGSTWSEVPRYANTVDLRRLHTIIGDELYDQATITKTNLTALAQGHPDEASILATMMSVPVGTQVRRTKAKQLKAKE